MNWLTIIYIGIATFVLLFFLIMITRRETKEYDSFSGDDYSKNAEQPKHETEV